MSNKIWFTSDTHFGSERTLELSKRPFKTVEEMDKTIIDNWNLVVGKDDVVYHLGDFGCYERVKELNGNIILICGNYEIDDIDNKFESNCNNFIDYALNLGFNSISISEYFNPTGNYSIWVDIKDEHCIINMVHKPSDLSNIFSLNEYNLFGHIHGLQRVKKRGLNVGGGGRCP